MRTAVRHAAIEGSTRAGTAADEVVDPTLDTSMASLLRLVLLLGSVMSSAFGIVALTAPSTAAAHLGIGEADPLRGGTALGIAALLATTFLVTRPRGSGVQYHSVRHHEPTEVRRPVPQNLRPKVGKKVRAKVRAAAAKQVAGTAPRPKR